MSKSLHVDFRPHTLTDGKVILETINTVNPKVTVWMIPNVPRREVLFVTTTGESRRETIETVIRELTDVGINLEEVAPTFVAQFNVSIQG